MTGEELKSVLQSYEKALKSFRKALKQSKTEWVRDSAIRRFEYTFDLAWKSIKRFAQKEGLECHVLSYEINEEKKLVTLLDFDHHDNIYKI